MQQGRALQMSHVVLDDIAFKVNTDRLFKRIRIDRDSEYGDQVLALAEQANEIGRPKVVYTLSYIDSKQEDHVVVDGVKLTSRVMRVNFADIHRVFPYAATCGRELYEWAEGLEDILEQFWAGAIMEMALATALECFHAHLEDRYHLGKVKSMNPGSLEDWPIQQQKELFSILGDVRDSIGIELTDSCLMIPIKSTSGIVFQTESNFESCQLCPRKNCPNRRAKYNEHLYDEKYKQVKS
jgi:hypothetical protein